MDRAVSNTVELLRVPIRDAVRMATQTPAEILGIHSKGRIVPGADADLVLLAPSGAVYETIVGGETVYLGSREDEGLPDSPRS
jgi:N-acetylglucosamine-6-phosphate deacetylase